LTRRINYFWRVVLMRVPGWRLKFFSEIGVPVKEKLRQTGLLAFGGWLTPRFWLPRSHDFNAGTKKKYVEKLNYIHFTGDPGEPRFLTCWGRSQ
jgi:hypothetical protein